MKDRAGWVLHRGYMSLDLPLTLNPDSSVLVGMWEQEAVGQHAEVGHVASR